MNSAAPKPKRERPSPPAHLSDRGKAGWAEAVLIADRMGVLTEADGLALEALSEAIADIRAARAALARPLVLAIHPEEGEPVLREAAAAGERYYWTYGKGGPMRRPRPELADISDADRRLAMWLSKFGMTPADRSRVSGEPDNEANVFDEMFGS